MYLCHECKRKLMALGRRAEAFFVAYICSTFIENIPHTMDSIICPTLARAFPQIILPHLDPGQSEIITQWHVSLPAWHANASQRHLLRFLLDQMQECVITLEFRLRVTQTGSRVVLMMSCDENQFLFEYCWVNYTIIGCIMQQFWQWPHHQCRLI